MNMKSSVWTAQNASLVDSLHFKELDGDVETDVLIVGGGY